ncbi:MAG: hypothetical protein C4527_23935 [Candidatus Omnitrophota bacterium]|jgi:hypothetical protein|nr:MAG: hypothetical protein C4527_23935 [Candidatus Omnitrophota bacterium]
MISGFVTVSPQLNRTIVRLYLIILFLGWLFLFVPTLTREYAIHAVLFTDASFFCYDDYPKNPNKSLLLFKALGIVTLYFIYRIGAGTSYFLRRKPLYLTCYCVGAASIALWWPSVLLVFLILFLISYPWHQEEEAAKQCWKIVLALFCASFLLRIEKLPNVAFVPLQLDASSFLNLSQSMSWFYDTHHREPLLCFFVKLITLIFPIPPDVATHGYLPMRFFTVMLSCIAVVMTFGFGRAFFSARVGFLAALLMALNKGMVYRSLQGLREELVIIAVFAVIWVAFVKKTVKNQAFSFGILWGIAMGMILLVRTSFLPFVFFILLWAWWKEYRSLRECIVAAMIAAILVSPYYLYCWKLFGDPFYSGNVHIRFYYEAVFGKGSLTGRTITPAEIMLQVYPWYQSIAFTTEGFLDTLFGRYALRLFYVPLSPVLIGASLIGYGLWLKHSHKRVFVWITLLLIGPMAFFMGMLNHSDTVFDWRLVVHLTPFMAFAAGEGLFELLERSFGGMEMNPGKE